MRLFEVCFEGCIEVVCIEVVLRVGLRKTGKQLLVLREEDEMRERIETGKNMIDIRNGARIMYVFVYK